jgi:hypothetical protein
MNTGIRPPRVVNANVMSGQMFNGTLDLALNGRLAWLHLPAGVICAVIGDCHFVAMRHGNYL